MTSGGTGRRTVFWLGPSVLAPDGARGRSMRAIPLWWRVPAWAAMTVATVLAAHGTADRVLAGVLMGTASVAIQLLVHDSVTVRRGAVLTATVLALAACFASPSGLAEVAVLVAATRAPGAFEGAALQWFTVLSTVAFGATVGLISHSLVGVLAGLGVPLLLQRAVEQRELVRERDRATALLVEAEAGRESEAQAAALRERGRIAREMHDVLAHTLAGLSVQLQAVRAVAAREGVGPAVLDPLDKAAELAREGLTEARSAVSTLRDPVGLGLDALPALIARHPGRADLVVDGEPGKVTSDAGHAVYRAVQESLTNAARYAPGAPVTVHLRWDGQLQVTVHDTGAVPGRPGMDGPSTGLGLAGMAERLTAVGGHVEAGPATGSGWQVTLTVPVESR